MPVFIAIVSAWAALYFGLVPTDQTRAAYVAYLLPFGFGLVGYLAFQMLRAPLVLHREQERKIRRLSAELERARSSKEENIGPILLHHLNESAANRPMEEHTRALREYTQQLRRQNLRQSLGEAIRPPMTRPRAAVKIECGNEPHLLVTNQGSAAEFYGVLNIEGMVGGEHSGDIFCKWAHTDNVRTKIANGQTCRISLATLVWNPHPLVTAQWTINAATESGPVKIPVIYSSCAQTGERHDAPDIVLSGAIFADRDLSNGSQPFRVVLKAFGSVAESPNV